MRRDRLRLACALEHEQLRENSDRLEIYGKGPHDLRQVKVVIEYEGQEETGSEEVRNLERVNGRVVGGPGACRQRVPDRNAWMTDRKTDFMR
jgi:hypothetical protein